MFPGVRQLSDEFRQAFGEWITKTEGVTNPYDYTGCYLEPGGIDDVQYYRNRYYFASFGIFSSRDAMWADIHRGWGYVGNTPTVYVDPWGTSECKAGEVQCQAADTKVVTPGLNPNLGDTVDDLLDSLSTLGKVSEVGGISGGVIKGAAKQARKKCKAIEGGE